jgi:hypothetical protein
MKLIRGIFDRVKGSETIFQGCCSRATSRGTVL